MIRQKVANPPLTSLLLLTSLSLLLTVSNGASIPSSRSPLILSSPRITSFGDWGEFDFCPEGTFVLGMRLKTEPAQGPGDDTALNGISFMCGQPREPQRILHQQHRQIQSSVGHWGTWGVSYECPQGTYVVGFQLRSEADQRNHDDTGANNLRIYCGTAELFTEGQRGQYRYLEGSGMGWGEWTEPQFCPVGMAICAVRTQVEGYRGQTMDDTALNNVDAQCCRVNEA